MQHADPVNAFLGGKVMRLMLASPGTGAAPVLYRIGPNRSFWFWGLGPRLQRRKPPQFCKLNETAASWTTRSKWIEPSSPSVSEIPEFVCLFLRIETRNA